VRRHRRSYPGLAKWIEDHNALHVSPVRHILGIKLPASKRASRGDDGAVPIREAVLRFSRLERQLDPARAQVTDIAVAIRRGNSSISDRANGIEIQTPCLIDKIGSEIIVRFFCNLSEAYAAVDLPCSR